MIIISCWGFYDVRRLLFVYVYIKSDASNTKSYILTRHRSQKNNLNVHILCCLGETNYILFTL